MEHDSKAWTGREARSKSYPSLTELIDKYVPLRTRGSVFSMAAVYEDRITDLLRTIHDYHQRYEAMAKHIVEMEKEFYSRVAIPVRLGSFEGSTEYAFHDMTTITTLDWRPEPQRMRYVMRDDYRINEQDHPHLWEMVMRQFEERAKADLIPKLRTEFEKLYVTSHDRRR